MKKSTLIHEIRNKKSCLCVGLDSDVDKLPSQFPRNAASMLDFNKAIIDATADLCVAYKINTAFYERLGAAGWQVLEQTAAYISAEHFKIADAKRGDIGNTSLQYAHAFFEHMNFDAVTVAPYMGRDSIEPFLTYPGKWAIILALTSNEGSRDFQKSLAGDGLLWQKVVAKTMLYGSDQNTMFVVGATRTSDLDAVRSIIPRHFLLVPGVGAQGGDLANVMQDGMNEEVGLLINASRSVIFASSGTDFAEKARQVAQSYQTEMKVYL